MEPLAQQSCGIYAAMRMIGYRKHTLAINASVGAESSYRRGWLFSLPCSISNQKLECKYDRVANYTNF